MSLVFVSLSTSHGVPRGHSGRRAGGWSRRARAAISAAARSPYASAAATTHTQHMTGPSVSEAFLQKTIH